MTTGYSGKPLYQKLGIKEGARVVTVNAPEDYKTLLEGMPAGMKLTTSQKGSGDVIHLFTTARKGLARELPKLMKRIAPNGVIWVSWPKKSARVATDITEDVIRDVALPLGLVDVKVCAVSDVWSGLKLVIRVSNR